MNQKNSLDIDLCFKDLDNPIDLFVDWYNEAKKTEIIKQRTVQHLKLILVTPW